MKSFSIALLLIALLSTTVAFTQQQQQPPCMMEGYDQFDFWIGSWEVFDAETGTLVGTNEVKQILGNCVIEENWTSAVGYSRGKSFNSYQPSTKTWKQVWVDNGGSMIAFEGKLDGNIMKLETEQVSPDGKKVMQRLYFTWDPEKNEVRQTWTQSSDGETWLPLFDAFYRPKE